MRQDWRITVRALRLWDDEVNFCFTFIARIVKDIRYGQSYAILDLVVEVLLVEVVELHLRPKQQMLKEECLDSGQDAARSTLILINTILDVLVEKEALPP